MTKPFLWMPYCGAAPSPLELAGRWNMDPPLVIGLVLGTMAVAHLAPGRPERRYGLAACAVLFVLFVSPFCALTSALFSARVGHHLVLTALVAPLLAGLPPRRRPLGGLARWTALHAMVFWFWHAPRAYETALAHDGVYWLMQASLLLSAWALWRFVASSPPLVGIAALLATSVQMGLLGALLTFASTPLYAPHSLGPLAWELTSLEDQQLAGLLMWVGGAGLYLIAALLLAGRWFAREQKMAAA